MMLVATIVAWWFITCALLGAAWVGLVEIARWRRRRQDRLIDEAFAVHRDRQAKRAADLAARAEWDAYPVGLSPSDEVIDERERRAQAAHGRGPAPEDWRTW